MLTFFSVAPTVKLIFVMVSQKNQWLCLSCQMQRAQAEANKVPLSPLKKETVPVSQQKPVGSTDATEKQQRLSAGATTGSKPPSEVPPTQKTPLQQDHNVSAKSTTPPKTGSTKEETGFFGFGRSRSPSPQPAVSGKVFGFGSSLLSSASNLISTAVQDESSTTSQATQDMSTASQTSVKTTLTPGPSEKGSANLPPIHGANSEKEMESKAEKKTTVQGNVITEGERKSELPKACPLCKAEITKNPSSYNTCTSCKSTVCNLCGFNPVPHQTEVRNLCKTFLIYMSKILFFVSANHLLKYHLQIQTSLYFFVYIELCFIVANQSYHPAGKGVVVFELPDAKSFRTSTGRTPRYHKTSTCITTKTSHSNSRFFTE